ncbi:MAG: hypothetical protein F6K48_02760 [Okeania sp. SIO3H1]|nr:hypothetical protein [Okeania sp. SIO3H1]
MVRIGVNPPAGPYLPTPSPSWEGEGRGSQSDRVRRNGNCGGNSGKNCHLIFLPLLAQNANSLSFLDISNFLFTE